MPIPVLKLKHEGSTVYFPLYGKAATSSNGPNVRDPDLLFVYFGMAGDWGYVSKSVREAVEAAGKKLDRLSPRAVCRLLDLPSAICLEVDTGWNGVDWFAWKRPSPKP